jgi:outer membrane immunogenic protein
MSKLSKLAAGSVIAATAALGGASVALADGYSAKPKVAYERPSDWSGVYFGLHSGYQWSNYDASYTNFPTSWGVSNDGPVVGAQLGIQHQFGQIVLGVETSITFAVRDDFGSTLCPNPAFTCTARFDDVYTIGGRIGYAAGHWMPYVTGGYAAARFEDERRFTAAGTLFGSGSERHDGWYIGGGVEWMVGQSWVLGVEYRHYELDDKTYNFHTPAGVAQPLEQTIGDVSLDTVTARVSWKWGREPARPLK